MDSKNIAGPVKAAILIHALGKPLSERLLQRLSDPEKERIHRHLSQIRTIAPEVVAQVAREFAAIAQRYKSKPTSVSATAGTGPKSGVDAAAETNGLEAIQSLSAEQVFDLIKDEQPQTIAIILVHLKTGVASDVIAKLPDEIKTEVAMRVVNLDKVTAAIVNEVNAVLKEILKTKQNSISNVSGGIDRLAEMLNQTDEISSELILNELEEADMEVAAQVKQRMFVFEDILLVDDRGVQKLLRKVETMELAIALKAASEEVRQKIFKNMSERAGEMLQEEIEDMGPVRMKEVTDAQQNITNIIQEMETKGELIIAGRRGDDIID
ncbi:MAG: flagellar motor switch protein FliG [Deltaproteobacteria bacterium]|nr:flagellar motor switch protein FliG [Deltaproteobacteria bacterium]